MTILIALAVTILILTQILYCFKILKTQSKSCHDITEYKKEVQNQCEKEKTPLLQKSIELCKINSDIQIDSVYKNNKYNSLDEIRC